MISVIAAERLFGRGLIHHLLRLNSSYAAKYDGKEYPVIGQSWDRISIRQKDADVFTTETRKTGGKYHFKGRIVISTDGKL
jgi:hypothetical protein